MSERSEVAEKIAAFIVTNHLCDVYGGSVELSSDKKYRSVGFSKPASLDGEVRIYGPHFIMVRWTARYLNIPPDGVRIFGSVGDALTFMDLAFLAHDESAMSVPHIGY